MHLGQILGQGFGQQDDVGLRQQPLARAEPGDQWAELVVRKPERLAVARLEEDPVTQVRLDALEVTRVDRQPALACPCVTWR